MQQCSDEKKEEIKNYYSQTDDDSESIFCQKRADNGESECKILDNALCANDDELFLQGDVLFSRTFAGLNIELESCHDNPDLTDDQKDSECVSKQDIEDYMASMILFINIDFQQIDM